VTGTSPGISNLTKGAQNSPNIIASLHATMQSLELFPSINNIACLEIFVALHHASFAHTHTAMPSRTTSHAT
jgi:hypothetical protein